MTLKSALALAIVSLCLLSEAALLAAPPKTAPAKKSAPAFYQCTKCHMKVSAAAAKKSHYKDSMDGGTFVPVKK